MLRLARLVGALTALLMLPLLAGFGACGGDDPPPEPRGCTSPATASEVTALELGAADGLFEPSARATSMRGGQGLSMLGYRIGVRATGPVTCIRVSDTLNLAVTPSGEWFATDPIWHIYDGAPLDVTVESYGLRVQRTMTTAYPDAATPIVDAAR